jgi:hypothetical protein
VLAASQEGETMVPLMLDDLLPLDEYAGKRREYFESHRRYLDRYRRVRIGPLATLVFENRQTLWFRIQEVLRIARLSEPAAVQQQLELFNRLLPGPNQLRAALLVETDDEAPLMAQLAPWAELVGEHIRLLLENDSYPATVVTCRPEDRCIGATHWVQFTLDDTGHERLADLRQGALLEIDLPAYRHRSALLSDEIKQSLADDLKRTEST